MPKLRNGSKRDSNPGSLDCDILLLSCSAYIQQFMLLSPISFPFFRVNGEFCHDTNGIIKSFLPVCQVDMSWILHNRLYAM